ncbi:MAG: hypothetical protein C5B48_02375 [Candidatus Rokuibacteriota bacterium]|nr:MAG: hypothetical protein C5B48_02375 [Candidatus Rokubacteria bacterium]
MGPRKHLHGPSHHQLSHGRRAWSKKKVAALAIVLGLLSSEARPEDGAAQWPPFLPSSVSFSSDVVSAVERTWTDRTLSRTVRGPSVPASFDLYSALVDAPDVTAAAARYRALSRDEVHRVGDDVFEASDKNGARGFYRVLVRERGRRVNYSWGEHSGSILGTIRGDALTVLTMEPDAGGVEQTLTAYVRIDNPFLGALARALLVPFGGLADRKLAEGLKVATRVAEWAASDPDDFCAWLDRAPVPHERRAPIQRLVPGCQEGQQSQAPALR